MDTPSLFPDPSDLADCHDLLRADDALICELAERDWQAVQRDLDADWRL